MATNVQQLIEGAYSRSTANDPGKLATDGELLGLANRIYHVLFALAAAAAPERYTSRVTTGMAGNPATASLSVDVIDVRQVLNASGATVNVIPAEEVNRGWHLAPAVFRQGGTLVSRNKTGDPTNGDSITIVQLDAPADLTGLSSTLDARFPTRHVELIIVEMAMYLATKDTGRDAAEFAALKEYRTLQLQMFVQLSGLSMTALQSPHGGMVLQKINELMKVATGGGQ